MSDVIIDDNLQYILESIALIEERFSRINIQDDLVSSPEGVIILDAIAMRLQVIGELLKKTRKIDKSIFDGYPDIAWDNIMRLRDIVSHHYEKVDHEIIYDICKNHIPGLKATIYNIIKNMNS
jgi:uncharacterized protein with HEPN domain